MLKDVIIERSLLDVTWIISRNWDRRTFGEVWVSTPVNSTRQQAVTTFQRVLNRLNSSVSKRLAKITEVSWFRCDCVLLGQNNLY